jgi:hypothetical protein
VNDWETKWDEDDDDSDEDEEIVDCHNGQQQPPPPLHPPMRPGMDPTTPGQPSMMPLPVSLPAQPFASPPPNTTTHTTKSHLVTATPEQESAVTIPTRPATKRQDSEDGLEWDTGALATEEEDDKPNVQMFLPLLRVLGKGSFGKVSTLINQ